MMNKNKAIFFFLRPAVICLLLSACAQASLRPGQSSMPKTLDPANSSSSVGENAPAPIQAYFTDPLSLKAGQREGGVDEAMAQAVGKARETIDVAMLNINLESFADALLRAQQRGVRVRLVMESGSLDGDVPQRLKRGEIPIIGDRRESLMHNKFMIIDGYEVWTGSLNLTDTGAYDDDNNMVRIRSSQVAEDFTAEFNEMFEEDLFGDNVRAATPNPLVMIDGTPVEVYFSPDDGVLNHLLLFARSAKTSIDFLAFSFTSDALANTLIRQADAGIRVRGVFDADQVNSNQGGDYRWMKQSGLEIRRDTLPGQMHNKVMIVDGKAVVTGSYNFSNSAEHYNDENVVIIHDTQVAGSFQKEFEIIYQRSE